MSSQDRSPAFQFYAKDWLADPKVRALTWDQKGRYIDLLCSMWEHGDAGCMIPRKTAEKIYGKAFIRDICDPHSGLLISVSEESRLNVFSNRLFQEAQKSNSRRAAAKQAADLRWEQERAMQAQCKGKER